MSNSNSGKVPPKQAAPVVAGSFRAIGDLVRDLVAKVDLDRKK